MSEARVYRTQAGSEVRISGQYGGKVEIIFDWFEEPAACPDCRAQTDCFGGTLHWECDYCGGGFADLELVTTHAPD